MISPDFNDVVRANHKRLRFIARRYGGAAHEDDVYQEVLLQLWRSFNSFRGESNRTTWIYRIGLNAALMWQRKESSIRWVSNSELPEVSTPHGQCQGSVLEDFFDSLNEIDSMILMMHLDDIDVSEVAEVIGISVNAVHIRINRLKQKFNARYVD